MKLFGITNVVALLILPASFAQTWVGNTASNLSWISISGSLDGKKLTAVALSGPVFTSTNSGADWTTNNSPTGGWSSIASSASGNILTACPNPSGLGYLSTDGGTTWNYVGRSGSRIAMAADGKFLAIASTLISVSTNQGTNWQTTSAPSKTWTCLEVSATGAKAIAAARNDGVYTSSDFGNTWVSNSVSPRLWSAAALSADGSVAVVTAGMKNGSVGPVYVSTNGFTNWFQANAPLSNWVSVAMSADARKMYALSAGSSPGSPNPIFTSANLGVDWFQIPGPNAWWSDLVVSADGGKLAAVASGTNAIFTSEVLVKPILHITKNDNLHISWLTPSTDFALQQIFNLTTDDWSQVTGAPGLNLTNLHQQVFLPATNPTVFFRLGKL